MNVTYATLEYIRRNVSVALDETTFDTYDRRDPENKDPVPPDTWNLLIDEHAQLVDVLVSIEGTLDRLLDSEAVSA